MDRIALADAIVARLNTTFSEAREQWNCLGRIPSAIVDDLLPVEVTTSVHGAFPKSDRMMFKSSMKERKHVGAQMDRYDPLLEEIVYAFQDERVVTLIGNITGMADLEPDSQLYAGGISAMSKGAYLRPHLDNSHDNKRQRYRVLNLLFYVTPEWREHDGGALQLWDDGPKGAPRTIASKFNRLVLMATNRQSWHSVNEVKCDTARRCVSNYYFSRSPPSGADYFHATSFRAEHGRGPSDVMMRADNALRTTILKLTGDKIFKNPHLYKTSKPD
ncbi:2OG-Fe(II) oxygenase [Sandarakinorhabdus sp. DWP1-3-1]|uniref:2OG-Fe(II) oxygenase n=1 Tax=Sandarakinorhabdus sp. DWP1-3-1 TaxID=2804627 RepID=UPI003CE8B529